MPVVNIRVEKMKRLLGVDMPVKTIAEKIAELGMSVEETDSVLRVEYNPNRPDFSSVYGVARALRSYLGIKTGLPKYSFTKSRITMFVDPSVQTIRPYIACAVVSDVKLDEEDLIDIISMQEDLHWIIGRNRRKTAIGLHDMAAIRPPFTYKAVGFDELKFVPLKDYRAMTPGEVLEKSEIGRKHAWLLKDKPKAPVIVDSQGQVFSMPPIVNAAITELTPGRRNIFIDVTGTEWEKVNQALNILVAALVDHGGTAQHVKVVYGRKAVYTPDFREGVIKLDVRLASKLVGIALSARQAVSLLRRMGLDGRVKDGKIVVRYPAYRVDIMHPVDLVEDISIAYGYNNMVPQKPESNTYGKLLPSTHFYELAAEIMTGLGYTEVHNLMLTNETQHYKHMELEEQPHISLANPATREYTMVRTLLTPSVLSTLAFNKDNLYPQKIFEIGDVIHVEPSLPEKTFRRKHLAAATCHSDASYSEMKSTVDELVHMIGHTAEYTPYSLSIFIPGRCASINVDGVMVGFAGEVSPKVLENIGLSMPVACFEIFLQQFFERQQ
ncbi:MAG: phenylalanine--tRNA ligase subunit beta [Candidatus Caldarchaeum sp.]